MKCLRDFCHGGKKWRRGDEYTGGHAEFLTSMGYVGPLVDQSMVEKPEIADTTEKKEIEPPKKKERKKRVK